jgi:YesN/AraC family two-component response regulator
MMEKKKNSRYERVVNKVTEIIHREYADETLCLNSIASMINLSPGYLGKIFKMYMTKSVADYINQVRMENAAKLLAVSGLSIGDISNRVGFACSNYFYTVFRKNYGVTPSEYRQQAKSLSS